MGSKGIGIVASRSLDEPSLFCLPEHPVFNLTAIIVAVVGFEGLVHRSVGEYDKGIGTRVVALIGIIENNNGIEGISNEILAVLVTAAASLAVETSRGKRFDTHRVPVIDNRGLVFPLPIERFLSLVSRIPESVSERASV